MQFLLGDRLPYLVVLVLAWPIVVLNAYLGYRYIVFRSRNPVLTELPLPLSSAAFISARFPWVSPAATVKVTNPCFGQSDLVRLVDGGYLDNSGVETALGLIERLRRAAQAAKTLDPSLPAVGIHSFP